MRPSPSMLLALGAILLATGFAGCTFPEVAIDEAAGGGGGEPSCLKPCDCDGDNQEALGEACGGTDCDDEDADVFFGQPRWFEAPSKNGGFDYNCDGKDEKESEVVASCEALPVGPCDQMTNVFLGNEADVVCGQQAPFGDCVSMITSCQQQLDGTRIVRCR